ncbi:AN1-type zinc finger protein 3 isoform X2 [Pan troglodytes]|uniref:AN1-type zinc finger protein 3 isoform X2 n=1 Tax=Pan troglodytes TaxID=9598 RepID=UPI0030133A30
MGDAGSERSKAPSLPPRCPCGFWGSSKTMNLCSKCFAETGFCHVDQAGLELLSSSDPPASASQSAGITGESYSAWLVQNLNIAICISFSFCLQGTPQITAYYYFQKKQPDDDSAPSTSNSQSDLFSEETTSDNNNTSITTPTLSPSQQPLPTELNVTSPSKEEYSQSENEASPVKRPRLLENTERSEETSRSKQKSRRRCFQCQTKLELVQQELGSCRCGYVFCMLHRLPEQHDCTFDHMGRGREEAIMKMVKLDRKVGRSCQRIGEGCS